MRDNDKAIAACRQAQKVLSEIQLTHSGSPDLDYALDLLAEALDGESLPSCGAKRASTAIDDSL